MSVSVEFPPERGTASRWMRILIPVLIIAIGLGVLTYPVVASQWNNIRQTEVGRQYSDLNNQIDPQILNEELTTARTHNSGLGAGPFLDPWLSRVSEDNLEYQDYLTQLDGQSAMARLVVPGASIDLPIYHGTSEDTLAMGVGHLYGSHLPVGGEGTHTLLTGHTGLSDATLFDNLVDVEIGDSVHLSAAGEQLKYKVDTINVVLPDETDTLGPRAGEDLLTLITCTPYSVNTHRLLVTAHRVPLDPEVDAEVFNDTGLNWQWWMYALIAAAVLVLVLLVAWIRSVRRKATTASATSVAQRVE